MAWWLGGAVCRAHDIPNQRVDRSIQVTVKQEKLWIDYEVSLSELTLTQDLRSLIGSLPGEGRERWLDEFGKVTGPLNAKGFFIAVNREPIEPRFVSFGLKIEEHPRYTFRIEAVIPAEGKLEIYDTNYATSEGTSRLAIRGESGIRLSGDSLPTEVSEIPTRPVWELSDEEELRSKRVVVTYAVIKAPLSGIDAPAITPSQPVPSAKPATSTLIQGSWAVPRLTRFLDRNEKWSLPAILALSAVLGALHSLQPGHGKTLVSAISLGRGAGWSSPFILALTTGFVHTAIVLVVAVGLWLAGTSRVESLHVVLTRVAGFWIAAAGFWRMGRFLGGHGEHHATTGRPSIETPGTLELVGLGVSAGMVPCWDAVGLIVLASALGRLPLGVLCVLAFGAGMSLTLVMIAKLVRRFGSMFITGNAARFPYSERWLGVATGMLLAAVGCFLFF